MARAALDQGVRITSYSHIRRLQEYRWRIRDSSSRLLALTSIAVLATARVARRWNQTGQKFAGEPDIARTFFSAHTAVLWVAVVATYLWNLRSLASHGFPRFSQTISGGIGTSLAAASATFKLAFTSQDSPELMADLARTMVSPELGVSLVARARIVFITIGFALVYTLVAGLRLPKRPNRELHSHAQLEA